MYTIHSCRRGTRKAEMLMKEDKEWEVRPENEMAMRVSIPVRSLQ